MNLGIHLRTLPSLFRGELGIMSAQLSVKVHRTNGAVYDGSLPLADWLAQFPTEDHGIVSRKKVTGAFVTNIVANMVGNATNISEYRYHDLGTGTTAEANTDTTLETQVSTPTTRATGTRTQGGTATAPTFTTVATCGPLPTATIIEHGIFTTAARTTNELLDRSVFSAAPINAVSGDYATVSYVLTLAAEA